VGSLPATMVDEGVIEIFAHPDQESLKTGYVGRREIQFTWLC